MSTLPYPQPDLTSCEREPIHQLGHIQSFGALLAFNRDWFLAHYSTNAEALLGLPIAPAVGQRVTELFTTATVQKLRSAAATLIDGDQVDRLFGLDLRGDGALYDCALHQAGNYIVVEAEPHADGDLGRQIAVLRPIMSRLDRHREVAALCDEAARQLRHALAIDRVMVYRFHEDLSGEVIAEARREGLEGFHGLRYPKSDIPSQARALYLRNRFRIISDVAAEPVPILPAQTMEGAPLDLSMSTLRAVSPIHIEYLRNMGVGASLSISIIIGGKLWGLFACHHYGPKLLPYSQRTSAELFSELFSLVLERALSAEGSALRSRGREVHDRLMRDIAAGVSLAQSLPTLEPLIGRIIAHDGVSIFVDGVYDASGAAPNEEEFRAILPALNGAATSRILATDTLSERIPRARRFADRAAGALIIPVSRRPRDYLVLWRRELKQVVTWAGNPEKPVEYGPHGARLTPRKSFEAWQETVEGRAGRWTEAELQIAEGLRVSLLEIILRLTDDAVQERAKAQQQQELLIAELNHRVRNILNLIRGLINQSRAEALSVESFAEIVGGRIAALASAHDNITRENWSAAPFRDLAESEARAYLKDGSSERVVVTGPEAMIRPEAYTVLALVIHEMMTNSVKYGSLSDGSGRVALTLSRGEGDELRIAWRETGGPPVSPPTRRGFGSTIIERSIPFELDGDASISYDLSGVVAEFCIPARFIDWQSVPHTAARRKTEKPMDVATDRLPAQILLVEDSMIIALDTEDCLREFGVDGVRVESSVVGALDAIRKQAPDMALLDFNLGKESSEPVAEELARLGVPFWMATGYGEMAASIQDLGAQGVLTKPYGKQELAQLLADYAARG